LQFLERGIDTMWWHGHAMGGWGFLFLIIMRVLWWVLIILVVLALLRWLTGGGRSTTFRTTAAEELLGERFARGEIDEHEYRQRLDTLRSASRPIVKRWGRLTRRGARADGARADPG
jgi:putative membrane protein